MSLLLKFQDFGELQNGLASVQDRTQKSEYIKKFFLEKFGQGTGHLQVAFNETKIKLSWQPVKVDGESEKHHKHALMHAKNKRYQEAINQWVKAVALNPCDPDYFFNLGIAFFEIRNFQESIENLKRAINLCPIYFKAYLILGTVYLKVRKYDLAESYLKKSISFYPKHPLAYLNMGALYSIQKRYEEGIRMFVHCLDLSPKEVRAHFGLAKIYSIQGIPDKANQYFRNVIRIDSNRQLTNHAKRAMIASPLESQVEASVTPMAVIPKNIEELYQKGYSAFLHTNYEQSALMYSEYLKYKPNDDFVLFSLAQSHLRSGNVQKAIECYEKAITINPNKGLYFKELAICFNYLNQGKETFACLTKANKLGKNDSIMLTLAGKYLISQGEFEKAIDSLQQALRMNNNNLLAKIQLAIALIKSNEINQAVNQLQEIIHSPIKSPLKMDAESILKKLQQ